MGGAGPFTSPWRDKGYEFHDLRRFIEAMGVRFCVVHINRFLHCGPVAAGPASAETVACPRCGSENTVESSRFGSTACKALYKCLDCQEPFDYFKPY